MNTIQKIKVKQLISKLSNDPNYTLPLKEQAYYQSLLLKEGIELSLILTLLKMGEITFPKSFNFSLSPDFIEREKLKVKVNPDQNYFELCKQLDISFATEKEIKDINSMEKLNKPFTKGKKDTLTKEEQAFANDLKESDPDVEVKSGGYQNSDEGDMDEKDLEDNDIFKNVEEGKNDPIFQRIKHRRSIASSDDEEKVDYDQESESEESI